MKQLSLLAASLLFSAGVLAAAADDVSVQDPYVRLAPPNAPATGAFMVIKNTGDSPVKVVKAENPTSKLTELHNHINDKGVMRMRQVPSIDIPAKGQAELKPGGLHVMLIEMKAPLQEGQIVPITLGFEDGSSKQVDAKVVNMMAGKSMPQPVQHGKH